MRQKSNFQPQVKQNEYWSFNFFSTFTISAVSMKWDRRIGETQTIWLGRRALKMCSWYGIYIVAINSTSYIILASISVDSQNDVSYIEQQQKCRGLSNLQ